MYPPELASGHSKNHIPFSHLETNLNLYLESRYLPRRMVVKDPRNMIKADIQAFCDHVRERQDKHGVAEAFVFKGYHDGTQVVPSQYRRRFDKEKAAERARKQTRSRQSDKRAKLDKASKIALKGKQKETLSVIDPAAVDPGLAHPISSVLAHAVSTLSVIDPALAAGDPAMADPMSSVPAHAETPGTETVMVSDSIMRNLVNAGHHPMQPFNGPQDGLPMYYVHASALQLLEPQADSHNCDPVDPQGSMLAPDVPQNTTLRKLRARPSNNHSQSGDPHHAEGSSARTLRSHAKLNNQPGKKKRGRRT
jgi:hypothetical protein